MKKKFFTFLTLLLIPLSTYAAGVSIENPLNAGSIEELIGNAIRGLLGISGALALLMMVWGGISWMTAHGNTERVKKGRDTMVWAIFGLVAIFSSYVVINFIFTELLD